MDWHVEELNNKTLDLKYIANKSQDIRLFIFMLRHCHIRATPVTFVEYGLRDSNLI